VREEHKGLQRSFAIQAQLKSKAETNDEEVIDVTAIITSITITMSIVTITITIFTPTSPTTTFSEVLRCSCRYHVTI
jgi:hypothetical protein